MAPRSKITKLPAAVKDWLENALIEGNFSGYELLEAELKKLGFSIGKSAIHRHGQSMERRLAAVRASTEAARMIAEAAPDDADLRSAAVISLVQTDIFNVLLLLQEAEEAEPEARLKLMGTAARAIADLARSSISQKKWQVEIAATIRAEERAKAAEEATTAAKAAGASPETIAVIRQALGITA